MYMALTQLAPPSHQNATGKLIENIPLQAPVNFSVISWYLGVTLEGGGRSDCLKGRLATVVGRSAWLDESRVEVEST